MKVTMLDNVGGYDEGETYDLPEEFAKELIDKGSAQKK